MNWFLTKVMEDIPVIPSRGLSWKKVYGLIGFTGVSVGTSIGVGVWGGVEKGNKDSALVQIAEADKSASNNREHIQKLYDGRFWLRQNDVIRDSRTLIENLRRNATVRRGRK